MRTSRIAQLVATAGICVIAGAALVWSSGTPSERASLFGVKPFRIAMDKPRPDVVADGLAAAKLIAVMKDRCAAKGVPVNANATNDLNLTVFTSPKRDGYYAVHVQLEAKQLVCLFHEFIRDPETRALEPTWQSSWTGILKPEEFPRIEEELAKLVDEFAADWAIGNRGRK